MIDLVLQGTKANIAALLLQRGLTGADSRALPGCVTSWWGGNGKFMTAPPVYGNGPLQPPTVPAAYLTGFVLLARIRLPGDAIAEGAEQWQRSRVAKWIKNNGTIGSFGGMACVTVGSVRMMRGADVFAWLQSRGLPGHEWLGGNSL